MATDRLLVALGLACGLGAAACGHSGGDSPGSGGEPAVAAHGCLAQVAATYDFVRLVLRTDGTVWRAAMEPDFVQVETASGALHASAIAASGSSAYSNAIGCAIVDGGVWCFPLAGPLGGASDLGAGAAADPTSLVPQQVLTGADAASEPLTDVIQLSGGINGGGASFCAVKSDGSAWCWGYSTGSLLGPVKDEHTNHATQLMLDEKTPLERIAEVRVGYSASCARRDDGTVLCWGDNRYGQLGIDPKLEAIGKTYPIPIALESAATRLTASPGDTLCAILADTTVQCWGQSHYEQTGAPGDQESEPPTLVLTSAAGPPLDGVIDLAPDRGTQAMCANTAKAGLWCWGDAYGNDAARTPTGPYAAPPYQASPAAGPITAPLTSWGASNGQLVLIDGQGRLVFGAGQDPTAIQPPCD